MGAGHGHHLYLDGDSPVHRLPAHVKLVATLCFVLVVVLTPPTNYAAFAAYALLIGLVIAVARLPFGTVLPRLVIEIPFVLFVVLLPFLTPGDQVTVAGVSMSVPGLIGAFNVLAKSTLGVLASVVLAATTPARSLLLALERLHMPAVMVSIATFMLRYADVVAGELRRMTIARASRGFETRDLRHWPVVASSAGALFVRTYERGERVHLAMLSRGYDGRMPPLAEETVLPRDWAVAAVLPVAALLVMLMAVLL